MQIPSPCIGVCRIDPASRWCVGCARTGDEIARWGAAPELRARVWAELPARRVRMNLGLHRLAWTMRDLRAFVDETLQPGGGTWVCGPYGAVAEFSIGAGEAVRREDDATTLRLRTARGAIAVRLSEEVRAIAFGTGETPGSEIVVLALPREQVPAVASEGFARIGPDRDAVAPEGRAEVLYDLGLGRRSGCFGIRTADADLIAKLDPQLGAPWSLLLASAGGDIVRASPTRVVRNPIGRIEITTPIPPPGGASPPGPHTHFLPSFIAAGRDLPPSLALPDLYVPCLVHYPPRQAARLTDGHEAQHLDPRQRR